MKNINLKTLNRDIVFLKEKYNRELYMIDQENSGGISRKIYGMVREEIEEAKDLDWYQADMEVGKMLTVEFIIFDVRNSFFGGRGERIAKITYNFSENKEVIKLIYDYIKNEKLLAAEEELEKRELNARQKRILSIRDELF